MGVAPVEGVIARPEFVFEITAARQVVIAAFVGDLRLHAVVVVAHHLKHLQADFALTHGLRHEGHHLVGHVEVVGVEDDVAQRDAVNRAFERRDVFADVGHALFLESGEIRVLLHLRVCQADQFETGLNLLLLHQPEVVALLRFRKPLPEAGTPVRHRNLAVGGDAVEYVEGIGAARHLVNTVGIGRHARETVAHDDSLNRRPAGVRHHTVKVVPLFDGGLQRSRFIVVGAARKENPSGK